MSLGRRLEIWECCFFFQAEDGIRDIGVTGVQTCALPISGTPDQVASALKSWRVYARKGELQPDGSYLVDHSTFTYLMAPDGKYAAHFSHDVKIGRASCRERA